MIVEKLTEIETALREGGLKATVDPRELNPPAVWVSANNAVDQTLCMDPVITVDVVLIAPDNGIRPAIKTLDDMLTVALPSLASVCSSIENISLNDSAALSGVGSLPAFIVTVTI